MTNKALFLDRDGVINIDYGFVRRSTDFQFQTGLFNLCRHFQHKNYKIIVITNQSGVARGYFTEDDLNELHSYMINKLLKETITVTDIFYCVSVDDEHPDRKPNPGLFLKARDVYALDMAACVSVGDKERDIIAARKAGVGINILLTNDIACVTVADYKVADLQEVLALCIS
jgi:D,D-heptose 1,7-bisphosphate phosphatase